MSVNTTIDTETKLQREVTPPTPRQKAARSGRFIENWLHAHLNITAIAIAVAAFVARIALAGRTYFNPDEALHYLLMNEPSFLLAYKASLTNAHPPLIYALLYGAHLLGRSELMLRLPLVLAGTAFCWFTFKWVRTLFGEPAALFALIIAAFSPTMIALSAELREYALLLFFMVAALYFLERAFEQSSIRTMWLFSAFLYFAILSHYSAAFFAVTAGIYALARIADSGWPRKLTAAWALGEVGGLAIYLFLYITHLSKIKNNLAIWGTAFGATFYRFNQESIFHFSTNNTWKIFQYVFAQRYVAALMLIGFVAGAVLLLLKDLISSAKTLETRRAGILILLPFAVVWASAIAGIYPYIGSRHTAVLFPFAIAAASFFVAYVSRRQLWAALLLAGLLVGISNYYGNCPEPGITLADQRRELMTGAMNLMRSIPESDLILADMQSSQPLAYYYCGAENALFMSWSHVNFDQFRCNGHQIVSLHFWLLRPEGLARPFEQVTRNYGLKPGDRIWVFQAGWGGDLMAELPRRIEQLHCITPRTFGKNITIVPLTVGPDLLPATQTNCSN
jgi:dolichyl-phosphate-mannose-protein mannosyltransferase